MWRSNLIRPWIQQGSEIFSVKFRPQKSGPAALLAGAGGDANIGGAGGWGALRAMAGLYTSSLYRSSEALFVG